MKPIDRAGRLPRLTVMAAVLLGSQLVACGGGGDNNSDGSEPPPAKTVKLKFSGKVTDAPIANAAVTIHVGDQTFTGTADADGVYNIETEVDEDDAGGFVSIDAKGKDAQSFVEFTSLLGDFDDLVGQAGGDGTLSAGENFGTQVTNVSTAEAALLRQANGDQPISTGAALQSLGAKINGQDVLDLATAIKLAVDSSGDYPLPEGVTSTLALANNPSVATAFINAAQENHPETFADTQAAVAGDPDLTQPVSASQVPAKLTAAMLSTDVGFTFNYFNRVSAYAFNSDGTGSLSGGSFNTAIDWVIEGSTIKVTYDDPVEVVGYDVENCNGTIRQVQARHVSNGATLSLLSARTIATTETEQITYLDCPSLQPRSVTSTTARTILDASDFIAFTAADVGGARITFYVYDSVQHRVKADIGIFNADGTGSADVLGKAFEWTVDTAKRELVVTFDDGTIGHYRTLRAVDAHADDMFYVLETDDGTFADAGAALVELDDPEDVAAADVPGRYYQFGIGNEQEPDLPLKGFRLRFDVNGNGAQEDDYLDENGNVQTTQAPFHWRVEGDGIAAERSYNVDTQTPNCVPGSSAGCIVTDQRWVIPLASDGIRRYVLELRFTDTQNGVSASTPNTAFVRYYDYEPLSSGVAAKAAGKSQHARPSAAGARATRH